MPTRPHQYLHANALPTDCVEIHLTERPDLKANPPVFLHLVVRRKQLVREFVKAFKAFLMERYRPEHWTGDLRELDLSRIKQILDQKPG